MTRNPMLHPSSQAIAGTIETDDSRAAKVQALREAYLAGTLDLSIPEEGNGLRRLLRDVFSAPAGGRRR